MKRLFFFVSAPILCANLIILGCSANQKMSDPSPPAQSADAVAAKASAAPEEEPLLAHDDAWTAIHFGSTNLPASVGGIENVAELGVLLNATGSVSSFIDFEACLKRGAPAACEASDSRGIRQDMTKPAEPVALNFDELSGASQALVIFAVPYSVEKQLRQNWKVVQTTYPTQSWNSLVQSLAHFIVMSKFQDFAPFQFVEQHWVKMLKRWNPKVEIPADWVWHERISLFMDPSWGAGTPVSTVKKAWLKSVKQSPLWIWNGLIATATHHGEDRSTTFAYGWKDQLKAIRAFEDLRLASEGKTAAGKPGVKAIREQETAIHKFQRRMQGPPNCWNRFRVAFRRMTMDALSHKEITDAQMALLNGKAPPRDQAAVLKTLNPETSAAHALALNLDLYRDEETRPLVFQFDGAWANWIAGLKSRDVGVGDDVSRAPMLECSQKYEK